MLILSLEPAVAGHLALALRLYRDELRRRSIPCPPELLAIETAAVEASRGEQDGALESAEAIEVVLAAYRQAHEPPPYTVAQYAERMGVHPSTVRRWIRRGVLAADQYGRTTRIRRD